MDVLVRLATEPPDLAGLPAELDGIVTACLARAPAAAHVGGAARPAGDFTAAAGPRSAHAYLPAPAMAVISGYQHGPRQAARAPADGGEDTSGGAGAGTSNGTGGNGGGGTGTGGDIGGGTGAAEATFGSHTALPDRCPPGPAASCPSTAPTVLVRLTAARSSPPSGRPGAGACAWP
jgi:hypothetical protein